MSYCTDCAKYLNRIAELEAKLAACEWRPITPEDLPKVGDEVFTRYLEAHTIAPRAEDGIWENCANRTWTHFRAINPPQQGKP